MNQDQPNITQNVSGSDRHVSHAGPLVALATGLVLALAGDAYLLNRSNNLNDQVAQIKPILEARQQQMQGLRSDTSLAPQDRRAKAQEIMQDSKTKIEAVLNDTQKQQFEQMLQERRAHHNSQPQAQ